MGSYKKSFFYRLLNILYLGTYVWIIGFSMVIIGDSLSDIRAGSYTDWQLLSSVLFIPLIVVLIVVLIEFARFMCLYLIWGINLKCYKNRLVNFYEFINSHRLKIVLVLILLSFFCIGINRNFFEQSPSSGLVSSPTATPTPDVVKDLRRCVVLRDTSVERFDYSNWGRHGIIYRGIIENECEISLPCPEIRVVVSSDPEGQDLVDNSETFRPVSTLYGGIVKQFSETVEYSPSFMEGKYYGLELDFSSVKELRDF